ncbi:hypothetical protein [Zhongshania sp.]|uniref:hypothetical protein n=1 Tax=Zhongshania sp. TaxID=1971902 RepID=UPI0035678DA2
MAWKMLDAVSATGASEPVTLRMIPDEHTVHATWTGAPTAVTIKLQGSLLNPEEGEWEDLAEHSATAEEISNQSAMFHVVDKPVRYVRVDLDTLTGGTSPTVTTLYEAKEHC